MNDSNLSHGDVLFCFEGTASQQRLKNLMMRKQRLVERKYQSYKNEAEKYNQTFRNTPKIPCPSISVVRSLKLDDNFWDIGELTHPDKPWAVDPDTKVGIQVFLTVRNCEEELRRIAREVRQMIRSALHMEAKISCVNTLSKIRTSFIPEQSWSDKRTVHFLMG